MQVKATAVGYDGQAVRQPGDVFEMPDGLKAPWFVAVEDEPAVKAKGKKADQAGSDVA